MQNANKNGNILAEASGCRTKTPPDKPSNFNREISGEVGITGENGEGGANAVQFPVQSALGSILEFSANNPGKHPYDVVYFGQPQSGIGCPIKIGYTRDLFSRMYWLDIQIFRDLGFWSKIQPVALLPGGFQVEQMVHSMFGQLRLRDEWFRPSPELRDFIAEVRSLPEEIIPFPNREYFSRFGVAPTWSDSQ